MQRSSDEEDAQRATDVPSSKRPSKTKSIPKESPSTPASDDPSDEQCSCTAGDPVDSYQYFWHSPDTKECPSAPTSYHSANMVGSKKVYVFGGFNGRTRTNELKVLDTDKMVWSQLQLTGAPSARVNVRKWK